MIIYHMVSDKPKIPAEKLEEGYHKQQKQIENLIETSDQLIKLDNFGSSLIFSIIATEELSKLHLIQDHLKESTGITKREWNELVYEKGMHKRKLEKITKDSRKNLQKKTPEEIKELSKIFNSIDPGVKFSYEKIQNLPIELEQSKRKLDNIKLLYLYFNWEGNDWVSYSDKISAEDLQLLAEIQLFELKFLYYATCCLRIAGDNISDVKKYVSDKPFGQEYLELFDIRITKEYLDKFSKRDEFLISMVI